MSAHLLPSQTTSNFQKGLTFFTGLTVFNQAGRLLFMTIQSHDFQNEISVFFRGRYKSRLGGFYHSYAKRSLDLFLVVLTAPIVVPIILVMAALVAMDGGKPFYSQLRIGRNGRTFRIWKIRTMTIDADARLESYLAANPDARAEWESTQKLKEDPRITKVGRILRKTSLDELPQLLNVFVGSMSLIGPRPMMVCQKAQYPGVAYYWLRPGITGFWQISDRNDCDFADRALYDDKYARAVSFGTDMNVLAKTVSVVLKATGH
ncbi:sugar transferase [uncultured Tateyamaria sp.]|uniref:sugar transferase n=1 Tax=uncultured Tateyamaria sp. TaxID=455651 RepID=UPI002634DC25|nr:sugar transferase [uncultured Tateyamaria sp.]